MSKHTSSTIVVVAIVVLSIPVNIFVCLPHKHTLSQTLHILYRPDVMFLFERLFLIQSFLLHNFCHHMSKIFHLFFVCLVYLCHRFLYGQTENPPKYHSLIIDSTSLCIVIFRNIVILWFIIIAIISIDHIFLYNQIISINHSHIHLPLYRAHICYLNCFMQIRLFLLLLVCYNLYYSGMCSFVDVVCYVWSHTILIFIK